MTSNHKQGKAIGAYSMESDRIGSAMKLLLLVECLVQSLNTNLAIWSLQAFAQFHGVSLIDWTYLSNSYEVQFQTFSCILALENEIELVITWLVPIPHRDT